jgi:predicted enzyme related to lactoylglutathione lyase
MPRISHFEIPANDPERAVKFYSEAFGWKFQKWDGPMEYWMITTGEASEPGINGGLMRRRDPNQPPTNVITVPDVDAAIAKVTASGGTITVPKMAIPGVGWLAYFADTEGIMVGMMQSDEGAK